MPPNLVTFSLPCQKFSGTRWTNCHHKDRRVKELLLLTRPPCLELDYPESTRTALIISYIGCTHLIDLVSARVGLPGSYTAGASRRTTRQTTLGQGEPIAAGRRRGRVEIMQRANNLHRGAGVDESTSTLPAQVS